MRWSRLIRRAWAGFAIGVLWLVESLTQHDSVGLVLAIVVGFIVNPIVAYIWTVRESPPRSD